MKNLYLIFSILLFSLTTRAQYSMIPASPFKVCQYADQQTGVQAFNKGNFTYVYWLDKRSGKNEVYGQKLDAAGVPQWAANGKLIATATGAIQAMRVMPWQNGTFISWLTLDSSICKYINGAGNDVWAQPVLVATTGNGVIYMENTGYNVFPNDSGVTITHAVIYSGGSDLFTFNRVDFTGNLRWSPLQNMTTLQGYDYRTTSDNKNGFYVLSKGNGIGSTMYIKRYDMQGNAVWPATIDITSGTSSLGFAGNIYMSADTAANLFVCWEANGGTIQLTKLYAAGGFVWPSLRVAASGPTAQYPVRPALKLVNDKLYVTWLETSGSNSICMMQKIDTSGAIQWASGGIAIDTANGYYGYPKIALSDSNAVTVFYQGTPGVYFQSQRVRSNGTLSWLPKGRYVATVASDWVSYGDYVPLDDEVNGCNVVCWSTSASSDIAAAKICSDGMLVSIDESLNTVDKIRIYPNPAKDIVQFEGLESSMKLLSIFNSQGQLIEEIQLSGETQLQRSVKDIAAGLCIFRISDKEGQLISQGKFIVE